MLDPLYTYAEEHTAEPDEAGPDQRLRLSALFLLLQRAAMHHSDELGAGYGAMLEKNLLWVIVRQRAEIARLPHIGERLTVRTCPGETMHMLFPRYYELAAEGGEILAAGTSLWTLIHADTRKMAFSGEHRIALPGCRNDKGLISALKTPTGRPSDFFSYTAAYSDLDFNGHMNNTRYFDMAEDRVPGLAGAEVREVSVEYAAEIRPGETVTVGWSREGNTFLLSGGRDGARKFSMFLRTDAAAK